MLAKLLSVLPYLAKAGKFLHLVEDDLGHLSLSGIQLWASTYVNITEIFTSHDHWTQAIAAGGNVAAGALHAVKRAQTINASGDTLPPWTGESDPL